MPRQMPKVSTKYGAPMGRIGQRGDHLAPYKFRLFRVRLDSGGYDDGGAYWGHGEPLYCAIAPPVWDSHIKEECEGATVYLRAKSRDEAKAAILEDYPDCRFWR